MSKSCSLAKPTIVILIDGRAIAVLLSRLFQIILALPPLLRASEVFLDANCQWANFHPSLSSVIFPLHDTEGCSERASCHTRAIYKAKRLCVHFIGCCQCDS